MHTLTNHRTAFNLRRKKAVNLKKTTKPTSNFTYDLDAMKQALSQTKITLPKSAIVSDDSFDKWLNE
jgi:hypothetical protein